MDLFEQSRVTELESLIKRYQKSYYDGEGEISDAEFDLLWDELKQLDPANPILHKVGADSGNFAKIKHVMPMGSQEKAANPEQFLAWAQKHQYEEYLVEYKLDGASLELQYENGYLVRAVTRGDGSIGDDITANAKKMNGVHAAIYKDGALVPFTGGIRGEVIMTHEVHKTYFPDKANCRNAANGLMKRKDGQGSEYLKLIVYDALSTDDKKYFSNEEEKIKWENGKSIASHFESYDEAVERFGAVGLNSIPTWLKPYNVLSNGEKFRADMSRKLKDHAVIDEFTSVVNRECAISCSISISKYINKKHLKNKKQPTLYENHKNVLRYTIGLE